MSSAKQESKGYLSSELNEGSVALLDGKLMPVVLEINLNARLTALDLDFETVIRAC